MLGLLALVFFADNAKTKVQHIYNGSLDTERAKDMIECDQDGRLMVHTTKQYPTEDATCFHVFGRVMSGTIHANQQVRLLGENYSMFDEEDSRTLTTGISKIIQAFGCLASEAAKLVKTATKIPYNILTRWGAETSTALVLFLQTKV